MSRTTKAVLLVALSWMAWFGTSIYVSHKRQLPPATEIVTLPPTTQVDYPICGTVQPKEKPRRKDEIA